MIRMAIHDKSGNCMRCTVLGRTERATNKMQARNPQDDYPAELWLCDEHFCEFIKATKIPEEQKRAILARFEKPN